MNEKTLRRRFVLSGLVVVLAAGLGHGAMCQTKGPAPRSSAENYPAHAQQDEATIGAALLTRDQVRKAFVSDMGRCLVVEVAVYPQKNNRVEISLDDFTLRVAGSNIAAKPSDARDLSATLPDKPKADHDVVISQTNRAGYESPSTDPRTGERRPGGVYSGTSAGVGVGLGGSQPSSKDHERIGMLTELTAKALPEGKTAAPVSGYIYFSLPSQKDKKTAYQLEYTLNGNKMVLALP